MQPDQNRNPRSQPNAHPRDPVAMIRKLNVVGYAMIVLLVGCFGGWATTTELAGGVIASGTIIVESVDKKIRHPTGGVVKEILVRDGADVEEGQILVRLDDTVTRSSLGVLRAQFGENSARRARLIAERDLAEKITFPDLLLERGNESTVASAMNGEEKLFASRREARAGQRAQLRERISQSKQEVRGLNAQLEAKETEIELISKELVGVAELYKQNLVTISRYMALERDQTRARGERGQFISDIARASAKISETELQIIQIDQDFRSDVLKDLRETDGKIAELIDKMIAAEDQLKRTDIRAPRSGVVHALTVHTVGGVIANGEAIMSIVPHDDLIVEAKVMPNQVDRLEVGAPAIVRINAGNQRTMPELNGSLIHVSADTTRDSQQGQATGQSQAPGQGQAYYIARVTLPKHEIDRLGSFHLLPGMPSDVFIETGSRTPMQYLLKPLLEQIARTFKER
jgi:membrane fusion protein, type I secretion system